MVPIKDAGCRMQIGDICCSLRFDYPAVLPDSILMSMIETGDIARASLSVQVRSMGEMLKRSKRRRGTEYQLNTRVLGWVVSQNKRMWY